MKGPVFKHFDKKDGQALDILTVAANYPSQVQPWMINHLYQIEKNGGTNRIVSIGKDDMVFDQALQSCDLSKYYWNLGESHQALVTNAVKQLVNPATLGRTVRLLSKAGWPDSLKKKIVQAISAYSMTFKPDLIHCHSEPVGARLNHLIKANGAPLIHTFHGQTPVGVPTISRELRAQYTRHARAILVNTRFAQKQYEALGAVNDNFIVVPQGTDIEQWPFNPKPCPTGEEPLQLLTVGRVVEEKGHKYVIDAVDQLRKDNINAHYHIVGRGPEIDTLQEQINRLQLHNEITIHGLLTGDALKQQYQQAHIFVLPSLKGNGETWEETQGVVVQEAQASGLLVIGADSGGIAECIDDGENGFVVPDRDASAIYHTVKQLISAPDRWKQWQQNGRDWVTANYSLDAIGKRVVSIYQSIIAK
ncbi:glycosyltransferase family 4 protein [Salinimonas iocasae]|uniref:Glycosyltransferase family 4 protein n=1 Tax=Salinimonas iocasae TaxID=2572577 RepID=A0A5B7YCC5_9ALTE|nr:glycosyltransferase family 4 protein [Salinimonas iocasae]QCZ92913.1 glycosyltransferase family 4 protein [Salinimonas iocasae]